MSYAKMVAILSRGDELSHRIYDIYKEHNKLDKCE